MDFKPLIKIKLDEFSKESPDLKFGELLYSILRKPMLDSKPDGVSLSWLTEIEDKEFYTAIERAINNEKEHKK